MNLSLPSVTFIFIILHFFHFYHLFIFSILPFLLLATVVRHQRTCYGSWNHCRPLSLTSTGLRRCLQNTLTTASRSFPQRWWKLLLRGWLVGLVVVGGFQDSSNSLVGSLGGCECFGSGFGMVFSGFWRWVGWRVGGML